MKRSLRPYFVLTVLVLVTLSCSTLTDLSADAPAPVVTVAVSEPVVTPIYIPPAVDLISLEDTLVEIYQKVNPGVVALRVLVEDGGSRGSGFVIDKEGHIITNYHVVEGVTDLEVAFPSGLKTRAEILGTDLDSDIAVIKVDVSPDELYPLMFSDSDQVKVGQTVIAIGNPFGFN
ncbi:MAG: trypsin-like peptidase domain-containing protein, partial [Anaerolineales bacterium]